MVSFLHAFSPKPVCISFLSHTCHLSRPSHSPSFDHPTNILLRWGIPVGVNLLVYVLNQSQTHVYLRLIFGEEYSYEIPPYGISAVFYYFLTLRPEYLLSTLFLNSLSLCSSLMCCASQARLPDNPATLIQSIKMLIFPPNLLNKFAQFFYITCTFSSPEVYL